MKDPRIQAAVDAAIKEGRILSNRGVNAEALLGVPAQAPDPKPPPPAGVSFWRANFEKLADACTCEAHWQRCVIDLARASGARKIAHFRPARVMRGGVEKYETPIAEDGKGVFDLEIVMDRIIKVECKYGKNKPTEEQLDWLEAYRAAGVESYVWYPRDWNEILEVLRWR